MSTTKRVGFIVLRCVLSEPHNIAWNQCCHSINTQYPECRVVVIDDHSDYTIVKNLHDFNNLEVVDSEFSPGGGEALPYYYYLLNGAKWFDQAIVLHDSTVVQRRFAIPPTGFRPLWHFRAHYALSGERGECLLKLLHNHREVEKTYKAAQTWIGCFGCMSAVRHSYLSSKTDLKSLSGLCEEIKSRDDRKMMERLLGCMLYTQSSETRCGLFGSIAQTPDKWVLDLDMFQRNPARYAHMPIVKIWFARQTGR